MRISNFWYLVKQGFKNVFQNRMMSFSCIGVLVACMMLIGSAVIFTLTVNNIATEVSSQSKVVAYLENDALPEAVKKDLTRLDNIMEIEFTNKDEHLKNEKERYGEFSTLLDGLEGSENPLPDIFVLRVIDTEIIEETVAEIKAIRGVEKVDATIEVARVLAGIKRTVYYAGAGIVLILIVVSLAIITNTIKLTVFSRRREINIMKYVGATDMFIRLPFLVEGLVIGISAALIAYIVLAIGYPNLLNWAQLNYGSALGIIFSNAATFDDVSSYLLKGFCAIGSLIGLLASTVFVRKHLRV